MVTKVPTAPHQVDFVTLLTVARLRSIWPSAPGTGIARNRNYPAYKNLRRFGADLAGARRF